MLILTIQLFLIVLPYNNKLYYEARGWVKALEYILREYDCTLKEVETKTHR